MEEQRQTKVESGSKFRLKLSGLALFNAFDDSGRVDNLDVPSIALRQRPAYQEGGGGKGSRGVCGEGWDPEEARSREQALKMLTIWPAYSAFEENLRGAVEVGKLADLTVLSADIMKIPELDILKTHCLMTVIGGEIVYQSAPGTAAIETDFSRLPADGLWWASSADDE